MKLFDLITVFLCATFFSANIAAAGFVKFEGIDGESMDADHEKWIEVLSMDWGMLRAATTGQSRRRGSAVIEDISFSTDFNLASPELMQALADGRVLRSALIHFHQAGEERKTQPYLVYRLSNVQISGYHFSYGGDGAPVDQVSFNFEEIEVDYISPDSEEESSFHWRVDEGR